nr:LuxR C-terminal-related transcriptional regulator [Aneurinibacillus tyrosinisolvens]
MKTLLSNREKEVAILIAKGYTDVEIARKLFISRRRVGEIIFAIKSKYQVGSRVKIGIMVYHQGWLDIQDIIGANDHAEKSTVY